MTHAAGAGMAGPQFVQNIAPTLSSRNITDTAQTTSTAPKILSLASTPNPGAPERNIALGDYQQRTQQQTHQDALATIAQNRQDKIDAAAQAQQNRVDAQIQAQKDRENNLRLVASLRPPRAETLVPVTTVDEKGNKVTKFVAKHEGDTYVAPENSVTANRVSSAETVNQVGNDIIAKLSDPKTAATLGPVLGRYSSVQDFIGDPDPAYSELKGEIESYALASMGVHGMRSAQGAQMIQKLLTGQHTPASLAASIKGLNTFSQDFAAAHKPTSSPSSTAPPVTGPKVIRYGMDGKPIGGG